MKRYFVVLIASCVMYAAVSCNNGKEDNGDTKYFSYVVAGVTAYVELEDYEGNEEFVESIKEAIVKQMRPKGTAYKMQSNGADAESSSGEVTISGEGQADVVASYVIRNEEANIWLTIKHRDSETEVYRIVSDNGFFFVKDFLSDYEGSPVRVTRAEGFERILQVK